MSEPQPMATPEASPRGRRQFLEGVVVSDKMAKTVVVQVERLVRDPRYGKYVRSSSRFMAHDEKDQCRVGDRVVIASDRPRSRLKRWVVRSVVSRVERQ